MSVVLSNIGQLVFYQKMFIKVERDIVDVILHQQRGKVRPQVEIVRPEELCHGSVTVELLLGSRLLPGSADDPSGSALPGGLQHGLEVLHHLLGLLGRGGSHEVASGVQGNGSGAPQKAPRGDRLGVRSVRLRGLCRKNGFFLHNSLLL